MSGARRAGLVDTEDLEPPVDEEADTEVGEMPAEDDSVWWWPFWVSRGEVGPEEEERERERSPSMASASAKGFSCSRGSSVIIVWLGSGQEDCGWLRLLDGMASK